MASVQPAAVDREVSTPPEKTRLDSSATAVHDGSNSSPEPEPAREYPSGAKLTMIMVSLCMGIFCLALDNTIIATATPRIMDEFHTLQDIGWYGSAYLLTTCAFQLFYGKLYSLFNPKFVFLVALLLFEVGSVICGAAPTSPAFITGRAIAGVGSAGLYGGAFVIVAFITPLEKRPLYAACTAICYGVASVVGPLIGGAFTQHVTWRWCFYINLPIGAVTAAIVVVFLNSSVLGTRKREGGFLKLLWSLDPIGTIGFVPCIVCLLLALQWGGTTYAWSSGRIAALLVVFAVLLVFFVGLQYWLGETATVPARIFLQRNVCFSSLFGLFQGGTFFVAMYFIPIWFQAILGNDPLTSGIHTIPSVLSLVISLMIGGALTTAIGHYVQFVYLSVVLTAIATGLLTTWTSQTGINHWIGYQIILGFGCGLGWQLPQIAAQAVLPLEDVSIGVSTTFFAMILGGAVFVSAGNNILNTQLVKNIAALNIPSVDPLQVVNLGATQLRGYVPQEYLTQTVEGYNQALVKVFQMTLICACLALIGGLGMQWRSLKDGPSAKAAQAEVKGEVEADEKV